MNYRFMRLMVFFDLPTETANDRKNYAIFRKMLIKEGFIMMQESIYVKLALNNSVIASVEKKLQKAKPSKGLVQILTVTEKQYASMETLVGDFSTNIINDTERLIIL